MATKTKKGEAKKMDGVLPYIARAYCYSPGSMKIFEAKFAEIEKLAKSLGRRKPSRSDLASRLFEAAVKINPKDFFN
jgi:hypothetical protein